MSGYVILYSGMLPNAVLIYEMMTIINDDRVTEFYLLIHLVTFQFNIAGFLF